MIRSFFVDGIFGNVIRFIFDRFFGGIFTNNINFSNIINLKNCHFKDLTIDSEKINQKLFKNSPFQLFSGHIGSFSIKFPSLNALLTESLEVRLDNLDIVLVMNDVDFSKAEQEINSQMAKNNSGDNSQEADEENNMGGNGAQDFDVYKKIINRILFNMKLKVKNICIRVVAEKPYKKVRLPIAPCFMLKIAKIEVKKNYEQGANSEPPKEMQNNMLFNKNQNYDIHIYGITLHMMANYELKPDEYIGKSVDPKAEFPFTYPNEAHPSTFFICACRRFKKSKIDDPAATINQEAIEPISIRINFSNDRSKSVDINIPNIEIMFDFLKIKFLSRYVDKLMEWKKYLDYKKALQEQILSQRKSPQVGPLESPNFQKLRKGSFDLNPMENANYPHRKRHSEAKYPSFTNLDSNIMPNPPGSGPSNKIRIAGYDIDLNYFQKSNGQGDVNEMGERPPKEMNVNFEGLSELASDPFELTADNLLDTSNVHINLNIKSIYIYLLKSVSAFLEIEFRRRWLFGGDPQADLKKNFNKKIPVNYFQLKCSNLNLSMHTKEGSTALSFSAFKIFDVTRVEMPLRLRSSNVSAPASNLSAFKSQNPWNKSEVFHSIRMDKSMMMSGLLRMPELKRNTSSDPNDSLLFQSAMSDLTKDFLTLREVRKQIVDWDLDPKREHFCVNVIFRFNKASRSEFSKDKKSSDSFKTAKYLEDSYIHSPLNTDPLAKEVPNAQAKPTLRFQAKGPKIVASLELPPVYVNFYMGIVHDINFLLHNASDSYKICEEWYLEQNQNLIRKWEQELREVSKQEGQPRDESLKKKETEAVDKERIDEIVEAYYKKQNQLLSLDVSLVVPFIKIAVNLENTKKDPNQCFCGFSSHYFVDNVVYNPIFKKEFVITELSQLVIKVLKVPSNEHFYAQSSSNMKKITALQTHVLFQNLDIYVPSKMKDENKVLMMKLLSIHPVQFEGNLIVPSIMLTTYEDNNSVLVAKTTEPSARKDLLDPINENRQKEGLSKRKKSHDDIEERKMDFGNKPYEKKEEPSWATSQKIYCAYFQKHMNKHMSADLDYLKLLDEDAIGSLKVTVPRFEVFISNQTLEFLRNFSKDGLSLVEDINAKLAQIIDQERRLFTSLLEMTKPQKTPPIANLSLYVEEIAINLFQDEKVNQTFHQIIESKNKLKKKAPNLGESDIFLDASLTGPGWEKSYSAPAPQNFEMKEMRCHYPEKEFEKVLESSLKVLIRHSEAIVYKNPKELVDIVHLEIHDLLVVDKLQEKPCFGSFQKSTNEAMMEVTKEYLDEEKQYEAQECIVYKQSCWNSWSKPLSASRILKEPGTFADLRNKDIFILENPHIAFEYKNKNVLSLGILKNMVEEKQKVEIEARAGFLVFRSDLKFGFVDVLNDIASCFNQNSGERKEEANNTEHSNSIYNSIEKKETYEEPSLSIQCSLENIMVDINPYINYDYCKTFGKINFGIDPDSLDPEQKDLLFYSDIRSLIALESLTLKLNKKANKVQFDRFEVTSLDVLLRHQKPDPTLKENRIILRSKEDSFFEREFEELNHLYGYKSHPLYLSGLSLTSLAEEMKKLELKLSKVELNLYADTIPTIEKHLHLILCLIEKRKQVNNEQQDIIIEEQKELEKELNMASSKQEGSSKPKDYVVVEDEIEIDKEYFAPIDLVSRSKQSMNIRMQKEDSNEGFEDVENIEDDDLQDFEAEESNKSYETVNSMPSVSSSFVSSSTVFYFDEDNLHDFSLENQSVSKKLTFKVDEICLKIFESYEFDSDPILMEIPMTPSGEDNSTSRSTELQTILMSHDQNRFEPLPKGVNENEKAECIMVVFEAFSMGLIFFTKNENLRTNLAWRASVTLENFEILDCFKNSKKGEANVKLFSKFLQKSPNGSRPNSLQLGGSQRNSGGIKISNTFDAIFECFEHNNCQQKDLRAFMVIHPIEIYFGTPHYNFTKLFLAKMNLKSPAPQVKDNSEGGIIQNKSLDYSGFQRQKRSSEMFVSFCHIAPVELKMNLNLDISIINLDLFKNLTLSFPSLVIRGAENSDDVKKEAVEFYTRRVKKQLGKFIKDLPILRNIKNLTSATFNIFYTPYLNYRESGNLLYGLKDGFFGFVGSVSNESANLLTFVTTMVDNAATMTGIRERLSRPDSQQNQ